MPENLPAVRGTPVIPIISVVMSVHNGEKYLREAVESILNQTFRDFEFIIIDDGSTDGSKTILEEYAAKDSRIRLVSRENCGLTKSLNEGLALARGEFIARMDADDISLPKRFEKQIEFLNSHPDYVVVGAEVLMIDEEGDALCLLDLKKEHELIDQESLTGRGCSMSHPVVMIRKSALDLIDGYDANFPTGQDLDLYLRLCEVGRAFNLPETLLHWRQHPASINRTRFNTWSRMKGMAVGNAIRRRGIDAYTERVFYTVGMQNGVPIEAQYVVMARDGGNFCNSLKHLRRVVSKREMPLLWALRQVAAICEEIVRKFVRPKT